VTQPPPGSLRVLLVEDDDDDVLLTHAMLAETRGSGFTLDRARTLADVRVHLAAGSHDVYLVDYRLGLQNGLDIARAILLRERHHPVIMLTGQADHDVDVRAAELGIADFLVKGRIDAATLERSIRYAISNQGALRALGESEERYALALAGANDGLWDWNLRTDRLYISSRWKGMLGYGASEIGDDPQEWLERIHPGERGVVRRAIADHLQGHTAHFESEHRMRTRDGRYVWVLARGLAVTGIEGKATRFAGSLTDISERKRVESQLQHDALHDALTGLPNRVLFLDRLEHALRRGAREESRALAVLFLDLDRFKLVNDSLGHLTGDRLLVAFARRLEGVLRPGDSVARLGGDEFTILLEDLDSPEEAQQVADRILHALAEPVHIDEHDLYLSASIGIALPPRGATAGEVIRDADAAMYRAKAEGKGRHALFDTALHEQAVARLDLETRLRRGLRGERLDGYGLQVVYQPIIGVPGGRVTGVEALARWQDEDGTVLSPELFIPVAEETGLIRVLGRGVLQEACRQLRSWREDGAAEDISMSVNISRSQLLEPGFLDEVRDAIAEHRLHDGDLRLEITETEATADPEATRLALEAIHELAGVQIHLDDFGTGTSSLTFLHGFPGDALKIDRSFVEALSRDEGAFQIVKAILGLARNLGMEVVAEGVETDEQLALLEDLGCEFAQGFLFARPLSAAEACVVRRHGTAKEAA
jgi:diguanylate cyclase (GGDEF)-like protein/PAS domain S-box-containing protein